MLGVTVAYAQEKTGIGQDLSISGDNTRGRDVEEEPRASERFAFGLAKQSCFAHVKIDVQYVGFIDRHR
jgi:hypothetical protein